MIDEDVDQHESNDKKPKAAYSGLPIEMNAQRMLEIEIPLQ